MGEFPLMIVSYRKQSLQDRGKGVELERLWQQVNTAQGNPALKLKNLLNTLEAETPTFRNIF